MTQRRDQVARGAEIGGGVVAGGVGTMFGAAKLRDAYKEDYPNHYARQARKATKAAKTVTPQAGRLARIVSHGKPGFVPLVALTAGAATATGARRYRKHRDKAATVAKAGTDAFGVQRVAKSKDSRERAQAGAVRAIGSADASVRQVRGKLVPSGLNMVKLIDAKTHQIVARENSTMAKAHDPHTSLRRRERGAEVGLGAGAGVAAGASLRAVHQARGHAIDSTAHTAGRNRSFTSSRLHSENVVRETRAHEVAARDRHGKGITRGSLGDAAVGARATKRNLEHGLLQETKALHSAQSGMAALRRARNLRVTAVGLGAGTYLAHRRASGHDR